MKRGLIGAAYRLGKSLGLSHRARGDAARDARDWLTAIEAYEAHLAADPDDAPIWVQLGHAHKEQGFLEDALQAYGRGEALVPEDADLQLNIGHLQKVRGEVALALQAYARSASLQPELFGGAAMIAREQIFARMIWHGPNHSLPADLPDLVTVIEATETGGRRLFPDYFRSFETR